MKKEFKIRKLCRLCLSINFTLALHLESSPVADAFISNKELNQEQNLYPLDLMLCQKCGNVQLSHIVSPDILYRKYIYETVTSLGLVNHFRNYANNCVRELKLPKGSFIVDIGSNDGSLLRAFKHLEMKVLGIDPAVKIAKLATKNSIETIPDYFTKELAIKIKKTYGIPAIITANNLVANIDDLDTFIDSLKILLTNENVFIMETFYMPTVMKHMVFDCVYHEHLEYFSVKPLQTIFNRHGMEIISAEEINTKGGSIRITVQLKNGNKKIKASVQNKISKEEMDGMFTLQKYVYFSKQINVQKKKLLRAICNYKKTNKIIAGYGASASCTTLMYHFGLTDKLDFLIDDNPRKQGTYSPGCHIPVYSSRALTDKTPDVLVMLAWRYSKSILKNNKRYLRKSTTIILPLPSYNILK